MGKTDEQLQWRVHTPNLLKDLVECSMQPTLRQPLIIFRALLTKVAQRAIELDDEQLNTLMIRLTLYSVADPGDPAYDEQLCRDVLDKLKDAHD